MDTYEKKYNEALERARKAYNAILPENRGAKKIIEDAFPELAESEDERIRKELIAFFNEVQGVYWHDLAVDDILAWLEKQKDVQTEDEKEYVRTLKSLIADFLRGKEEVDRSYYQKIYDWLDGRHIEQKQILEVFGFKVGDAVRLKDGDGRKHIIKSFEEVEGIHGPNFYHVEFEDNSARDGIYPGEEYPNGYYTQMEKFEEEQKPAEWSEEDKDRVVQYLHDLDGGMLWSKATEITSDILDILRPLHPSWKPSEEQMEALKKVVAYFGDSWVSREQKALDSLYNDLDKLSNEGC